MPEKIKRIDILDALRGVAIIAMVVYHALFDLNYIFGVRIWFYDPLSLLEPPFAGLFILLAGVSCRFSHNNVKRGIRVFLFAMIVTLGTALFARDELIYFGILHFMGIAILIFALIKPLVDKIPKSVAIPLWAILFIITYTLPETLSIGFSFLHFQLPMWLRTVPNLYMFGLPDANFTSGDYFPLIPWFFLFMLGTVIGIPIKEKKLPERFYTAKVPVLAAAGRKTLLIYVVHQPVIYGALYLFFTYMYKR